MSDASLESRRSRSPFAADPWAFALQTAVRVLWLYVVAALLAALTMKYLVPEVGVGLPGLVERAAHGSPVLVVSALFVVFSALAHYWRFHLPGGRYASALPAHVARHERNPAALREWARIADAATALSLPGVRRRLVASAGPASVARLDELMGELRRAIEEQDLARASEAARAASETAARATAAHRAWIVAGLALALGLIVLVRRTLAEPYEVLSASMLPTLETGDSVVANKRAYRGSAPGAGTPSRGEVIVFRSGAVPLGPGTWPGTLVKRVVGLPGDRVEVREGGLVLINGWAVPSCDAGRYVHMMGPAEGEALESNLRVEFLGSTTYLTLRSATMPRMAKAYAVGPAEVFVLGDNRSNSLDSRVWNGGRGGGVPLSAIDGRVDRYLLGSQPDGEPDFGRLLQPLGALQQRPPTAGYNAASLRDGIARCLKDRPVVTEPPAISGLSPIGAAP